MYISVVWLNQKDKENPIYNVVLCFYNGVVVEVVLTVTPTSSQLKNYMLYKSRRAITPF